MDSDLVIVPCDGVAERRIRLMAVSLPNKIAKLRRPSGARGGMLSLSGSS